MQPHRGFNVWRLSRGEKNPSAFGPWPSRQKNADTTTLQSVFMPLTPVRFPPGYEFGKRPPAADRTKVNPAVALTEDDAGAVTTVDMATILSWSEEELLHYLNAQALSLFAQYPHTRIRPAHVDSRALPPAGDNIVTRSLTIMPPDDIFAEGAAFWMENDAVVFAPWFWRLVGTKARNTFFKHYLKCHQTSGEDVHLVKAAFAAQARVVKSAADKRRSRAGMHKKGLL